MVKEVYISEVEVHRCVINLDGAIAVVGIPCHFKKENGEVISIITDPFPRREEALAAEARLHSYVASCQEVRRFRVESNKGT